MWREHSYRTKLSSQLFVSVLELNRNLENRVFLSLRTFPPAESPQGCLWDVGLGLGTFGTADAAASSPHGSLFPAQKGTHKSFRRPDSWSRSSRVTKGSEGSFQSISHCSTCELANTDGEFSIPEIAAVPAWPQGFIQDLCPGIPQPGTCVMAGGPYPFSNNIKPEGWIFWEDFDFKNSFFKNNRKFHSKGNSQPR